jgi:hypothetical protein
VGTQILGAIEPQFFAAMMARLPIDNDIYGGQHDRAADLAKTGVVHRDGFETEVISEYNSRASSLP